MTHVKSIDAKMKDPNVNSDPVLCAQDVPEKLEVTTKTQSTTATEVLANEHYMHLQTVRVSLVSRIGKWKIDSITCPAK
jgi:hypothetical protein